MRLTETEHAVEIVLSRRNLLAMLAKLDGHPPRSACTITKAPDDPRDRTLILVAEEDELHYASRGYPAGVMHPDTEMEVGK